jgi:hypothetical protein
MVVLPVLSMTFTDPEVFPLAVGFDVTVKVQFAPTPSELAQLFVCAKLPVTLIVVRPRAAEVSFVNVAVCDGLTVPAGTAAKVREVGENSPDPTTPVPVRGTDCGLLAASSVKITASLFAPVDCGRNATVTVQFPPAATLVGAVGHVVAVSWKSDPTAIDEMFSATVWLLVNITVWVLDVPPTATFPQLREVGENDIGEPLTPVPVMLAVCVPPPPLSVTVNVAVCVPVLWGVNVIEIVQCEPAATEPLQLSLSVNTELDTAMLDMLTAADSLFVNVNAAGVLLVPVVWFGKV